MKSYRTLEVHAYLAGPDVFLPDALAIGEKKKAYLEKAAAESSQYRRKWQIPFHPSKEVTIISTACAF